MAASTREHLVDVGHKYDMNNSNITMKNANTLIWVQGKINGQIVHVMWDTGAIPCCIAYRCVKNSSKLKRIPINNYQGHPIVDASGNIMTPEFVITTVVTIGQPDISVKCDFVAIKNPSIFVYTGAKLSETV